jgi:hypothetical protein
MHPGQKPTIAKLVQSLCLISIEKNRSLAELAEELVADDEELNADDLLGFTRTERQRVQQYRWKRVQDRKQRPKTYVGTCIDHGVAISGEEKNLKAIEVEILRRRENK